MVLLPQLRRVARSRRARALLVETAKAHPRAAAVAPRLERPDGTLEFSTLPFPSTRIAAVVNLGVHRMLSRRTQGRAAARRLLAPRPRPRRRLGGRRRAAVSPRRTGRDRRFRRTVLHVRRRPRVGLARPSSRLRDVVRTQRDHSPRRQRVRRAGVQHATHHRVSPQHAPLLQRSARPARPPRCTAASKRSAQPVSG